MSTQTMAPSTLRPASNLAGRNLAGMDVAGKNATSRPSSVVPPEVSNPWSGRQAPCTASEEVRFVEDLELLSGYDDVDEFERRDVTVLLTALRCGLAPRSLLAQAPGVRPNRLLAAHREIESRRLLSEHAWLTIAVDPCRVAFETFARCASELLPAVISRLATHRHDEVELQQAIEDAAEQVVRTTRRVLVLEQRLAEAGDDPGRAREIGTLLYDVHGQGAWSLPTFMPPRVGAIVPLRLGALLGDEMSAGRRAS